jgi:Xaa-Pro aminopeptidase
LRISESVAVEAHEDRRASLVGGLAAAALDGIIVSHLPNVRYLTGFSGTSGIALLWAEEVVLFTDFRYREQAEAEVGRCVRVEIVPRDMWGGVVAFAVDLSNLRTVGFEAHVVTERVAARLRDEGRTEFRSVSGLVERLRERKDSEEVAHIRAAAALASDALDAVLPMVSVGVREIDIAAALERELRLRGSEWHPFPTIVASGPRTALPHARTTDRSIGEGEWVLLDFGAQVDGYCADITRTFIVGRADERQRMVYDLVREAQQRALTSLQAGQTGSAADAAARTVFESRGFGDAFGHSLGHGLGLEVHEAPSLSRTNEQPLPEGSVFTVEPGLYFPGWGGVRLEDDVYLASDGVEMLSDGRTELQELI